MLVSNSFQLDRRLAFVAADLAKAQESGKRVEQAAGAGGNRRIDPPHKHLPNDTEFGSVEGRDRGQLAHIESPLAVSLVKQAEGGTAGFADCPITAGQSEWPEFGKTAPSSSRNR